MQISIDAKFQRCQQENILPVALINIIGKVAVKRHFIKLHENIEHKAG